MREKKYLDALIAAGFIAVKEYHYSILNSCVDFGHRFFYLNVERVITAPSDAGSEILSQFDEFALEKHLPECMPLRVSPLLSAFKLDF